MILGRFLPHAVIKALKMLGQSKKNKSARSANPYKSFCYFLLLQKVESPYPLDSNLQSKVALIRSYIIYFTHCLKSRALDTSLHCVPLSMTRWGVDSHILDCFGESAIRLAMTNRPHSVILSLYKRRSIHFGDSRIARDILTLSESICLRFTRFATFHTTFKGIKIQT